MLHWTSQRSVLPFVVMNTAKKHCKDLFSKNFVSTFAPSFENDTCLVHGVMVVTTGFGSVSQGSNPCGPTTKIPKRKPRDFLYMYVKRVCRLSESCGACAIFRSACRKSREHCGIFCKHCRYWRMALPYCRNANMPGSVVLGKDKRNKGNPLCISHYQRFA